MVFGKKKKDKESKESKDISEEKVEKEEKKDGSFFKKLSRTVSSFRFSEDDEHTISSPTPKVNTVVDAPR
jgi:hypothetical protein